jgi:mRNA-degrading endonuclease HigB of HigAB toxin-antitoxin module
MQASILKGCRVVFNFKGNDCRMVAVIQHQGGVLAS